jgi:hypothetical protein
MTTTTNPKDHRSSASNTPPGQPKAKPKEKTAKATGRPLGGGSSYPPCSIEAFAALRKFLEQSKAFVEAPTITPPELGLLTVELHGPFRKIAVTNRNSPTPISFGFDNATLKVRNFPSANALLLRLLLAFGGACSVNDAGNGWAYLRLFGSDTEGVMWDRVTTNAGPFEIVRHRASDGRRNDHHDVDPDFRSIETLTPAVKTVSEEDGGDVPPKKRPPSRGRPEATASALARYRRNHQRSGIDLTESDYLQMLKDAFALVDAHRKLAA